jgi:hypothetical protein
MRSVPLVFVLFLLGSCAAPERRERPPVYSPLLSASDIREITALVANRSDMRKPVYEINTHSDQPDRFIVYTGHWEKAGDQADYVAVRKRHGKWRIISPVSHGTLRQEDIITLEHYIPN